MIAEASSWVGANVVLTAKNEAKLTEQASAISHATRGEPSTVAADVADDGSAEVIVEAAIDRFGSVDVLVNKAGINVRGPIGDISRTDFDRDGRQSDGSPVALPSRPTISGRHRSWSGHQRLLNVWPCWCFRPHSLCDLKGALVR